MATLTVQTSSRSGITPTYASCAGGGDDWANTGEEIIHIKNGSGGAITLTIVTPVTVDGLAVSDRTVSITAGEERIVGPFSQANYNSSDLCALTYSGVTSLTIGIFKVGA